LSKEGICCNILITFVHKLIDMYIIESIGFVFITATLFLVTYLIMALKKLARKINESPKKNHEGDKLKLQAIERLSLYAERCGLQNLIKRTDIAGITPADLHHILTETIKGEYEYNLSQQIYVSPEVWNAITRLRDQNIYVINQITSNLPPQATALDLSKMIIEYSMTPNAELNTIVLNALQVEAKTILK